MRDIDYRQSTALGVLVADLITFGTASSVGHLRDVVSSPQMYLQAIRSNVAFVAALHRASISGLVFSRGNTVLGLEMSSHIAHSMYACQHSSTSVWTRNSVLGAASC